MRTRYLNAIYTQLGASNEPDKEELRDFIRTITKSVGKSAEQVGGRQKHDRSL